MTSCARKTGVDKFGCVDTSIRNSPFDPTKGVFCTPAGFYTAVLDGDRLVGEGEMSLTRTSTSTNFGSGCVALLCNNLSASDTGGVVVVVEAKK